MKTIRALIALIGILQLASCSAPMPAKNGPQKEVYAKIAYVPWGVTTRARIRPVDVGHFAPIILSFPNPATTEEMNRAVERVVRDMQHLQSLPQAKDSGDEYDWRTEMTVKRQGSSHTDKYTVDRRITRCLHDGRIYLLRYSALEKSLIELRQQLEDFSPTWQHLRIQSRKG